MTFLAPTLPRARNKTLLFNPWGVLLEQGRVSELIPKIYESTIQHNKPYNRPFLMKEGNRDKPQGFSTERIALIADEAFEDGNRENLTLGELRELVLEASGVAVGDIDLEFAMLVGGFRMVTFESEKIGWRSRGNESSAHFGF